MVTLGHSWLQINKLDSKFSYEIKNYKENFKSHHDKSKSYSEAVKNR